MDLAEIRKKAKSEKRQETGVSEAPREVPEVFILEADGAGEELRDSMDELVVADLAVASQVPEQQEAAPAAASEAAPVAASEAVPENFDPLALLMAGRTDLHGDETESGQRVYAGGEEFQEFLCFRVSTEMYAINIMAIKEIIKPREVTDIPRAPGFVSGILSLRGIIIPVFNMRLRLGLPEGEESGRERIIVVKKVTQVVRIAPDSVEKPPAVLEGIDRDFVRGIGRYNGQMLILLNQDTILDISLGQRDERGKG